MCPARVAPPRSGRAPDPDRPGAPVRAVRRHRCSRSPPPTLAPPSAGRELLLLAGGGRRQTVDQTRAAFRACNHGSPNPTGARVEQKLAADEALEAGAADDRGQLLVERAVEVRDAHRLRNTPVTLPRTWTWVA